MVVLEELLLQNITTNMARVSLVKGGKMVSGGKKYTDQTTGKTTNKSTTVSGVTTPSFSSGSQGGEVLGAQSSLKDLSISLANRANTGVTSIKDLSVALAQGKNINQSDVNAGRVASIISPTPQTTTRSFSSPASTPSTPGSNSTSVVSGGSRYSRYTQKKDESPIEAPTYSEVYKDIAKDAQKEINSLYKYERSLLEEQNKINQENLAQTRSVNTLTGLAGSSEANVSTNRTLAQNQAENEKIKNEVATKIQGVLSQVRTDAMNMYQFEQGNARANAQEARAQQEEARTRAVENTTVLAQSGATAEGYKTTDPDGYAYLAQSLGGEDVLKAMFTLNRAQDTILDKKIEGGKYVIAYQNPLDGKIRIESVDLGLPPEYTKTIDAGDRILAIPDNWSGDPSELITINKGLTPTQQKGAGGGDSGGIYDRLDFRTANAVISQADKFTSSDIVKRFNNVQDSRNNIAAIDSNTQNPADHQAIIYYFAKSLDPESVVREGEYETIKKYAQNIFGRYKGELENALNGSGFLSQAAIANIKMTVENRYNSGLTQYKNKESETARVINTIAGQDVAGLVLTDYTGGGYGSNEQQPSDGLSEEEAYQIYLQQQNGS